MPLTPRLSNTRMELKRAWWLTWSPACSPAARTWSCFIPSSRWRPVSFSWLGSMCGKEPFRCPPTLPPRDHNKLRLRRSGITMCGINGYFAPGKKTGEAAEILVAMSRTMSHRGPDDSGCWSDDETGIGFGHRRLAIIDLSSEGHQPMHSAGGRFVITFNGEIYNFPALRHELEGRGHKFRGHSDTEMMLAAFTEWGVEAAIKRFVGMFAFAVLDREERVLHLSRDRLGEKPLYYGWSGDAFLFGSSLRALEQH